MSDIIDNLGAQVIQMIGAQDLSGWSDAHDSLVIDAVRTYLSERDEIARLRAELDAVRADAERYRWLRDAEWSATSHAEVWGAIDNCPDHAAKLDAAIDAAIDAQRAGGQA